MSHFLNSKFSIGIFAVLVILLGRAFFPSSADAFTAPTQAPPGGSGAIGSDAAGNLSVGISTTSSSVILFVVSSGANTAGFKVMQSNGTTPLFVVNTNGNVGIGASPGAYNLDVTNGSGGQGTINGIFVGTVPATNILGNITGLGSAGVFDSCIPSCNGASSRFAFPNTLEISTTSISASMPAGSVFAAYGGGYIKGNLSIATTTATAALTVQGNSVVSGFLSVATTTTGARIVVNGRIRADGTNYGIMVGTSSLSGTDQRLTVVGQIRSASTTGVAGGYVFPDGTIQVTAANLSGGGWTRDAGLGFIYTTALSDSVGIGTATPRSKTHVSGGSNAIRSTSAPSSNQGGAIVQGIVDTDSSFDRAIFSHNATWNETTNLWSVDAIGANDAAALLFRNAGRMDFIIHPDTGNVARTFTHANFLAGSKFAIDANGNVGIGVGTATPSVKLQVIGVAGISTSTSFVPNPAYTLNVSGTISADRVLNAVYAP